MTLTHPDVYRQSLLRGFTVCPRRTKHGLMVGDDAVVGWVERYGDLGTAFHEFAAEYLRTLYHQGQGQMPTQEAIEVMYEVLARLPFTLPFEQLDELRWLVLGFCDLLWNPKRILALEEELLADVVCPDGEVRVLKGQPDVLMADPPNSLIVVDYKSGRGRPRGPRVEPEVGEVVEDRKYLSDLFQGDVYSLLALRRYPTAENVIFRELHLRSGQIRQGRLSREQLEHVERKLAVVMMNLDRAISEGEESELWAPRPGSHCTRQCPVAVSCPIPKEQRGDGALEAPEDAHAAAEAYAVLEGQRKALIEQMKAWVEDPANPLPMANEDQVAAWKPPTGKGRRFGLWSKTDLESEAA
jgi:hypothetical protein